jgi:hypothetical protein
MAANGTDETSTGNLLSDDRLEILRMVEAGTVSAEEAARLFEALDRTERAAPGFPPPGPNQPTAPFRPEPARPNRVVRFRVTEGDQPVLNLALPLGLLDSGIKIAKRFTGDLMVDGGDLKQTVNEGFRGSLLDVNDGDQHVEIIVE